MPEDIQGNQVDTQIAISDEVLQEYKQAATKWEKELLQIPFNKAEDVLKYMRGVYGLRGKMMLPAISAKSGFAPYNPDRVTKADVNISYRQLETFLGSDIVRFHPNEYALTIMGYEDPTLGDALKGASTAAKVLTQIAMAKGEAIADAVINGVLNPEGDTTRDLCDGIVTIAKKDVEAGKISAANGNLYEMKEAFTNLNAVDIAKDIVFTSDAKLRKQNCVLLCSQAFADSYNESYLQTHSGILYNDKYEQPFVEGSNKKVTLAPIAEMEGSDYFILAPTYNLLWGTDNKSKFSTIQVDRFESFRLTLSSTCFLGTQFHSVDKSMLRVVKVFKGE